jgi:hypothetical protein
MKYLDDLIDRWHAEGLHFLPAASEAEVRNVFRAIGAEATADVITLFTSIGGMGEMDKEFWRLWTLDEIKSENTEHSSNRRAVLGLPGRIMVFQVEGQLGRHQRGPSRLLRRF